MYNFFHYQHYFSFFRKSLPNLYIMHGLNSLAFALVGLFIPLSLLSKGYSLSVILLFYMTYYSLLVPCSYIVLLLAKRFDLRIFLVLHSVAVILFLFCVQQVSSLYSILLAGVLLSIASSSYWMPLHCLFSSFSSKKHIGSQVGLLDAIPKVSSILAPAVGGFVVYLFGYGTLFYAGSVVYIVALIPVFLLKRTIVHNRFNYRMFGFMKKQPLFSYIITTNAIIKEMEFIIWPVLLFLILGNVLSIGFLGTVLALGVIIMTVTIGNYTEKHKLGRLLCIGGLCFTAIWFARIFVNNPLFLYGSTVVAAFVVPFISVPATSTYYSLTKKYYFQKEELIFFTETIINVGRVLILCLLYLFITSQYFVFVLLAFISVSLAFVCHRFDH